MKELLNKKLKDKGYKVVHNFIVLHEGWELDNWAAIVEKDRGVYLATTNHGSLEIKGGEEAISEIKSLLNRYEEAFRDTKLALEYLPT